MITTITEETSETTTDSCRHGTRACDQCLRDGVSVERAVITSRRSYPGFRGGQ